MENTHYICHLSIQQHIGLGKFIHLHVLELCKKKVIFLMCHYVLHYMCYWAVKFDLHRVISFQRMPSHVN